MIIVVAAIFAPLVAPHNPLTQDPYNGLQDPTWDHLLGTDQIGRDVLSRLIFGSRVALGVGFGAVALGVAIGMPLGMVSGYLRGWVDEALMRLVDVMISFPALILVLALVAVRGASVSNLVLAIGVANIPIMARITRGQVLAVREQDYVMAARAVGASAPRIIAVPHLPQHPRPDHRHEHAAGGVRGDRGSKPLVPRARDPPAHADVGLDAPVLLRIPAYHSAAVDSCRGLRSSCWCCR